MEEGLYGLEQLITMGMIWKIERAEWVTGYR